MIAEKEMKKLAKEWDQGYNEEVTPMPHRPSNVLLALKQKMIRSTSQGGFRLFVTNQITSDYLMAHMIETGYRHLYILASPCVV